MEAAEEREQEEVYSPLFICAIQDLINQSVTETVCLLTSSVQYQHKNSFHYCVLGDCAYSKFFHIAIF